MFLPLLNYHHSRPLRDSNPHLHKYRIIERDMGIEPTYPVWKTGILTVVLISRLKSNLITVPNSDNQFKFVLLII